MAGINRRKFGKEFLEMTIGALTLRPTQHTQKLCDFLAQNEDREKIIEFGEFRDQIIRELENFGQNLPGNKWGQIEKAKVRQQLDLLRAKDPLAHQVNQFSRELAAQPNKFALRLEDGEAEGQKKFHAIPLKLMTIAQYGHEPARQQALENISLFIQHNSQAFLDCGLPAQTREREIWRLKKEIVFELLRDGAVIKQAKGRLGDKIINDIKKVEKWAEEKVDGILAVILNLPDLLGPNKLQTINDLHFKDIIKYIKEAFLKDTAAHPKKQPADHNMIDNLVNGILNEVKTSMIYPMDACRNLFNYTAGLKILWENKKISADQKQIYLQPLVRAITFFQNSLKTTDNLFVRYYMSDGRTGSDEVAPDDSLAKPLEFLSRISQYLNAMGETDLAAEINRMIDQVWQSADEKLLKTGQLSLEKDGPKPVNYFVGHGTIKKGQIDLEQNTHDWPADGSRAINARLEDAERLLTTNQIKAAQRQILRGLRELRFLMRSALINRGKSICELNSLEAMEKFYTSEEWEKYEDFRQNSRLLQSWFWVEIVDGELNVKRCLDLGEDETSHQEWSDALAASLNLIEKLKKNKTLGCFDSTVKQEILDIGNEAIQFSLELFNDLKNIGESRLKQLSDESKIKYAPRITDALIQLSQTALLVNQTQTIMHEGRPYFLP